MHRLTCEITERLEAVSVLESHPVLLEDAGESEVLPNRYLAVGFGSLVKLVLEGQEAFELPQLSHLKAVKMHPRPGFRKEQLPQVRVEPLAG